MKKTKILTLGQYHSHHVLLSFADIVQNHVNMEQAGGGFTENATMSKEDLGIYHRQLGKDYQLTKTYDKRRIYKKTYRKRAFVLER